MHILCRINCSRSNSCIIFGNLVDGSWHTLCITLFFPTRITLSNICNCNWPLICHYYEYTSPLKCPVLYVNLYFFQHIYYPLLSNTNPPLSPPFPVNIVAALVICFNARWWPCSYYVLAHWGKKSHTLPSEYKTAFILLGILVKPFILIIVPFPQHQISFGITE